MQICKEYFGNHLLCVPQIKKTRIGIQSIKFEVGLVKEKFTNYLVIQHLNIFTIFLRTHLLGIHLITEPEQSFI